MPDAADPEVLSDLDHVYPMRATGHDQEWCPGNLFPELFAHADAGSIESFEDQ